LGRAFGAREALRTPGIEGKRFTEPHGCLGRETAAGLEESAASKAGSREMFENTALGLSRL
jgi:hypothetical protein